MNADLNAWEEVARLALDSCLETRLNGNQITYDH